MKVATPVLAAGLIACACTKHRDVRIPTPPLAPPAAAARSLQPASEEGPRFAGRVVDEAGGAVPRARVSDLWLFEDASAGEPFGGTECDEEGRFSTTVEAREGELWLVAYSTDRKLSGLALARSGPSAAPESPADVEIVVRPSVRVRGRVTGPEVGAPASTSLYWLSMPSETMLVQCSSQQAAFDAFLPQGDWRWLAFGTDLESREGNLELGPADLDLDLGVIEVQAAVLALLRGKPLPEWNVTTARGVPLEQSSLSSFRGKWLLVAYWGSWCEPCVSETLPRLAEFCEREKADRDRFEVVAFHDGSLKSSEALDEAVESVRELHWKGRELPFPVLHDETGETILKYGIRAFPTTLLVDPEGRLIGEADEKELKKQLDAHR